MTNLPKPRDQDDVSASMDFGASASFGAQSEIDALVTLARANFDAPLALLTLLDGETISISVAPEQDCSAAARDGDFYNLAARANQMLIVGDAALDPRFDGKRLGQGGEPIRFCVSMPLPLDDHAAIGALSIIDVRPRRLQSEQIELLAQMAKVATGLLRTSRHARAFEQPSRRADHLGLRYKKMFDRASALAKIGVWECNLADNALTWTDGVYDIFELPRGSALKRSRVLDLYTDESRIEMERLRSKAIAERGSFCLDIQIMTAKGAARWVRLSADIECEDGEPVRIFGLKQDITQEKDLLQRLQRLAECDPLTGIPNRSVFHARLQAAIGEAAEGRRLAALLLVDLDGFKQVNDTFGHLAGDECLRQVAARLQSTLGSDCFVARIGGDEFALLIYGARLPAEVEGDADALIRAIQQPAVWNGQTSRLGASIGIAIPEWTTRNPAQLFTQADLALYAAKKAGRNTYRVFTSRLSPRAALGDPAHPVWF